jgi:hypothetical protein
VTDRDPTLVGMVGSIPQQETPVELLRALAVFAEPPGDGHGRIAETLGFGTAPGASDFSDVFLFQLYPYASIHLGEEGMLGGEARERVAGFWSALGRTPSAEPDHLSALLGLYAALSGEVAAATDAPGDAAAPSEVALLAESRDALLHEHLAPWVPAYLDRVVEISPRTYGPWAAMLQDVLSAELRRAGRAQRLPLHLREAAALPDPREEGADAFLKGLLAPVRSGVILIRADLASLSGGLGLALRAGERRFALDSLLGQDAASVLAALAGVAGRQADAHEERIELLGVTASFFASRARASAALLSELATEDTVSAVGVGS